MVNRADIDNYWKNNDIRLCFIYFAYTGIDYVLRNNKVKNSDEHVDCAISIVMVSVLDNLV